MSVLSPKQALDDSTKATRNDAVTPRWHTCSHVGHRQIPPLPWRKDGDQNHAEPKGALENNYNLEVLDLQTMKKNMMFWRTFVRCSFWCPHFFFGAVNCQTVDFRDVDPIHPKVGSPVAVSVCWVWKKMLYEKSLPSLQGRLLPEVLDVVTHQLVGVKYNPSETIHFRSSLYPVISPQKKITLASRISSGLGQQSQS